MLNPLTSILIFGIYSALAGTVLLFVPQIVLPWFGIPIDGNSAWLRLIGFVLCSSAYYYIRSAMSGNIDFARYTVHTRLAAPIVVAVLVITKEAEWQLLPFGIVDGIGGIWTMITLRRNKVE